MHLGQSICQSLHCTACYLARDETQCPCSAMSPSPQAATDQAGSVDASTPGGIRTPDAGLRTPSLCPLSYRGWLADSIAQHVACDKLDCWLDFRGLLLPFSLGLPNASGCILPARRCPETLEVWVVRFCYRAIDGTIALESARSDPERVMWGDTNEERRFHLRATQPFAIRAAGWALASRRGDAPRSHG